VEVERLMRLSGVVKASAVAEPEAGLADAYPRIRQEVAEAVGDEYVAELDRLFPPELSTAGRPWGVQAAEAKSRMAQLGGWLDGMVDAAVLGQRIQAEAEAKARQTGFTAPPDS
jgi:hypothetical protein